MPGSRVADVAALVRFPNLILAAAGVAVGAYLVLGPQPWPSEAWFAVASALGLGAAGNVANDLYDVDADRVNRPRRPLSSGRVSRDVALAVGGLAGGAGLYLGWLAGTTVFRLALVALVVMLAYSPLLKRYGALGNLAVAAIASLPLIYGAAAAGYWRAGLVPFALAAVLHLAREVVKDLEDVAGDRASDPPRRTLPIVFGEPAAYVIAAAVLVIFIPLALAPWFANWYSWRYGALAALAAAGAAGLIVQLLHRRLDGVSTALKGIMVIGLAALLWDRL